MLSGTLLNAIGLPLTCSSDLIWKLALFSLMVCSPPVVFEVVSRAFLSEDQRQQQIRVERLADAHDIHPRQVQRILNATDGYFPLHALKREQDAFNADDLRENESHVDYERRWEDMTREFVTRIEAHD